nr:glyceraldehyde-3-phosphate dehydrogenase [Tetragenococcus halophilus]
MKMRMKTKKVIISAPTKDEETKVVVFGVNQEILSPSDKIISAASCTTNGLALMTKILVDEFGIQRGLMSGSRAYTATQNMQDAPGGRKSRAGTQNVIPVTTGAANALGKVIPEVKGIITGTTIRVPVITAGFVELFSVLDREVTVDQINEVMKAAANDSYGYTEDEIVSSDVVGVTHGSVFDATLTEVLDANGGQLVKTVAWYDNEYGFVSNLVRLTEYVSRLNK